MLTLETEMVKGGEKVMDGATVEVRLQPLKVEKEEFTLINHSGWCVSGKSTVTIVTVAVSLQFFVK